MTTTTIFSPLQLGPITLKNRIVFGPHATNQWPAHKADDRTTTYYERRARGGVGAIIIGGSEPDPKADYFPLNQPGMWTDDVIPGLERIAKAVHSHGCPLMIQLLHPGHMHNPTNSDDWIPAIAPSELPTVFPPAYSARKIEAGEIPDLVQLFASAALRAQEAGLDGVELQAAHGYLLGQFLSPIDNRRTDDYSVATIDNRSRITREIVKAIREACGAGFAIGVRLSIDEHLSFGSRPEDILLAGQAIAGAGTDYLSVSAGTYRSPHTMIPTRLTRDKGGYSIPMARRLKALVGETKVMVAGMLAEPAPMDEALAQGDMDAAVVVRQLIADSDYVAKISVPSGFDNVRPCLYLNQGCVARMLLGQRIECHANPEGFREVVPIRDGREELIVIGAGPAGLEAAHLAARAGFRVKVFERANEIGGQMRLMAKLPGVVDVTRWLEWAGRQLEENRVDLQLGVEVTSENIGTLGLEKASHVLLATGAKPVRDGSSALDARSIPGASAPHVLSYEEVLLRPDDTGRNVVIFDDLSDRIAPGIAKILAERGRHVTIVTRWQALGQVWLNLWAEAATVYRIMDELNVRIVPNCVVMQIETDLALAVNIYSSRITELRADTVVLATMRRSYSPLSDEVRERARRFSVIGDATVPRLIGEALRDARVAVERLVNDARARESK